MVTLPRGPQETQQRWYATARLGCYVCTIIAWGAGIAGGAGGPVVHFYCSRCKEKGSAYSMSIFVDFVSRFVDFGSVADATVWSDSGRHFRSNQGISTMSMYLLKSMCARSEVPRHAHTAKIVVGVPAHVKNVCDGMQGHLR